MKLALIGASALSILVADATAQRQGGGDQMAIWKTLAERYDKDKDGKLTSQEYARGEDKFSRWDSNGDGGVNISDVIHMLLVLFIGSEPGDCEDAWDVDDDGFQNITDPVALLNFLFLGGDRPPEPHPEPGPDPTGDSLTCKRGT